ncbi:MAG: molybdopterin-binding protein [Dehalococcoidales bacterium]|nr:molybdopterin-binding protein [Dehalococcoidales bacterium]
MKPFGALISYQEAKEVIDRYIQPITRTEAVPIDNALNRVLAEDLIALMDVPPFNRAAMDGYAVKAKDTFGAGQFKPKLFKITGEIHAGEKPDKKIKSGECLQISTGAVMPNGADSVVMVEDTERENSQIKVFKSVTPGTNVGKMGEDIKAGAVVLKADTCLDAGKVGVLASQGITRIKVYEKPRIAVLPTGEEVVPVGKKLKPGQLFDINSHTISAVVSTNGGVPVSIGIAGDKAEELRATIKEALQNDIVVLSGGSSVGERDLLVDVIEGWGKVLFHGVQVKPGKPTIFAMIDGKPLMGMPGYPTSCLINAYLFLMPAIRKMAHLPPRKGDTAKAKISRRVPGSTGRRQFLTVKLVGDEAVPVFKESGAITSIAEADGYIEIAENIDLLEKGDTVTVILF